MLAREINWLLQEKYRGEKSDAFFADCARLEAGEPLAYIIGQVPFLDCTIHLDSHPLIPRPETEYWTEKAITTIKTTLPRQGLGLALGLASGGVGTWGSSPKILDLCAGSGAIGVAVAKAIPEAQVTFAEIDPAHLPTIKKNLTSNTIIYDSTKYPMVVSDLFAHVSGTFDFILTNPPYIDRDAKTVDDSVVAHEPHLALFGGDNGMEIIARIITEAHKHLQPSGQLWIEHEPFQLEAIAHLAYLHGYTATHFTDQFDTRRYSVLTHPVAE